MDEDFTYLSVSMTEEQAAQAIETILCTGKESQIINPQADLRESQIYVSGQVKDQKTATLYPGSLTLRLWAENGALKARVIQLDFRGWDAFDAQLEKINQSLAQGLARQAERRNNQSELIEVVVKDGELAFTWKTPRQK